MNLSGFVRGRKKSGHVQPERRLCSFDARPIVLSNNPLDRGQRVIRDRRHTSGPNNGSEQLFSVAARYST